MSRFSRNGVDDDAYQINVITSDITYMKDTYCVAGWSPSTGQMKRLMINGNHWSDKDLKKIGKIRVIECERYTKRRWPQLSA